MVIVRRLLQMAAMLIVLSIALFYLLHAMPGSPEELLLASNPSLSTEELARIRSLRGLDRPIHERYACWLFGRSHASSGERACAYWPSEQGILGGDLGYSSVHNMRVSELLRLRLPATLSLMVPAFVLALLASIPLGVTAARKKKTAIDHLISGVGFLGISLPLHWLALLSVLLFAVKLGLFPASGIGGGGADSTLGTRIAHAVLPVSVLAFYFLGRWTRYVRASMLEVLELDFVRTARAKGLGERAVLYRHALPNALIPLVTVVAQSIPPLFSGALVIERVFSYPGMGLLIFESVTSNDYLVAIVVFLIYAALTMLSTLLADAVYFLLDPRVRAGAKPEVA